MNAIILLFDKLNVSLANKRFFKHCNGSVFSLKSTIWRFKPYSCVHIRHSYEWDIGFVQWKFPWMSNVLRRTINAFILKTGLEPDMWEMCTVWWTSALFEMCFSIWTLVQGLLIRWGVFELLENKHTSLWFPSASDVRDVLLPSLYTSTRPVSHQLALDLQVWTFIFEASEKSRHPASSKGAFTPDANDANKSCYSRVKFTTKQTRIRVMGGASVRQLQSRCKMYSCFCKSTNMYIQLQVPTYNHDYFVLHCCFGFSASARNDVTARASSWLVNAARISAKIPIFQLARMARQTLNSRRVIRAPSCRIEYRVFALT